MVSSPLSLRYQVLKVQALVAEVPSPPERAPHEHLCVPQLSGDATGPSPKAQTQSCSVQRSGLNFNAAMLTTVYVTF